MDYRVLADELTETLGAWDELIPGREKIRMIACGGTALTLLGYKESTKDVDFLLPDKGEYERLVKFLEGAGYEPVTSCGWKRSGENIIFDLYPGKRVYSTELLTSPLEEGGNRRVKEWKKIYLGVLNPVDLIISKLFRGTDADLQDSLELLKREKVDLKKLEKRYRETARYETGESRVLKNFALFLSRVKKEMK